MSTVICRGVVQASAGIPALRQRFVEEDVEVPPAVRQWWSFNQDYTQLEGSIAATGMPDRASCLPQRHRQPTRLSVCVPVQSV
jgi:hypothetical protein